MSSSVAVERNGRRHKYMYLNICILPQYAVSYSVGGRFTVALSSKKSKIIFGSHY